MTIFSFRSSRRRAAALLISAATGATLLGAGTANAQESSDALRPIADAVIDASGSLASIGDAVSSGSSFGPELPQVDRVDPTKFAGTWYQIAVLPQPTSLQCIDNTKAEYGVIDESTLSVRNSCDDVFGGNSAVVGKAFVKDAKTNASLRVAFDGIPGQNPDGPVNYRVTYLAEDYSLAIVGDPARRSGFVLSRTPGISDADWAKVAEILADRGYQPCTFITSPQAEGRRDFTPVCAISG
ncbi:lipocalin family protein [Corynebacterium hansenii]|uniref:Lipocalin family protein n=1 Tax=Corynebacterium hansenii TaxID=394964 RepID=A0ABV7ZRB5_9CORY|nr:lipocalin family protein [Corynebacterium hansenii]WJZ00242.1 Outer membrane lipoprotein Blc precursor [Corynebacterium hansenii]